MNHSAARGRYNLNMAPAIQAHLIGFGSTGERPAYCNLSFTVPIGGALGIYGESGTGKTLLQRALAGEVAPTHGHLKIFGFDSTTSVVRARCAFVPSSHVTGFSSRLTGLENLIYHGSRAGVTARQVTEIAERWLFELGMGEALRTPVELCSTGMLRALAVTRAFVADPHLVVLDEPFSGLSERASARLEALLLARRRSQTLVVGSASKFHACRLATQVLDLNRRLTVVEHALP
ncbi:MAG TPA: ATP-binding cassette domain-containing protein [Bdellovibrionales bacterium]|nr:ATP-binding cassette domain-containing protein [Bdellovibrionales bacterium]